jgi:light-regulated signal transduction histidine kinase (bacteriophytochrome)
MPDESKPDRRQVNAFMKRVGHELRDPLGNIISRAELILSGIEGKVNRTIREDVELIRTLATQALAVVDKVLELVYPEAEYAERFVFDIGPLVQGVCKDTWSAVVTSDHALVCDMPAALPPIQANRDAIRRIVNILIVSMMQVARYKMITVSARQDANRVAVHVHQGQEDDPAPLVDLGAFVQSRAGSMLSVDFLIARRLVESNGGEFWITGEVDSPGSVSFHFSLPVAGNLSPFSAQ